MSLASVNSHAYPIGVLLGGSGLYRPVALPKPDIGILLRPCKAGTGQTPSGVMPNAPSARAWKPTTANDLQEK